LIRKWGTKQQFKIFNLTNPYNKDKMGNTQEVYEDIKIPQGYRSVAEGSSLSPQYKEAYNYLIKRGITKDMMVKYNLGYTTEGPYSHRIIVPSYDKDGELNYFVARSYVRTKLKYKNPKVQKENIMFNEHTINWNEDIYLVEGVFDMFFLPNAIPLLGKNVSDYMWSMLYEKAKKNIIICLDGDAWESAMILYKKLNGGRLHSRVRLVKLPKDKDIGDLKGNIESLELIELEKD
jgi:DNA primase